MTTLAIALSRIAGGVASAQTPASQIDSYMRARVDLGQFSGAVLVARGGNVLLSKGYGYADLELATPNTHETRFLAASITKPFTAAALVQLRDAGTLALTDPFCRFVDACPAAWNAITIDQLIHHTSGIPDYEEVYEFGSSRYAQAMLGADNIRTILDTIRPLPLDFVPGSRYHYSNTGYLLLAQVVERASGRPYDVYLREHLFVPAGMKNSGIVPVGRLVPHLATGYSADDGVSIQAIAAGIPLLESAAYRAMPASIVAGAHGEGGLYTTVDDLYAWDRALKLGTVIPLASQQEMFKPGAGNYGFGWTIGMRFGEVDQSHNGLLPGFVSRIDRFPASDVTVIVMANVDFAKFTQISRDLAALALGKPYDTPTPRQLAERDRAAEASYVGTYTLGPGTKVTVTSGDELLQMRAPGQFNAGLVPFAATPRRFYVPFFEGDLLFSTDASGVVTGFILHYNGEDVRAIKSS